jgi:hypothetical protein
MTNSPYVVVWTESWNGAGYPEYGFINIAPIVINANGMISYDPSRKYWTSAARSSFGPALFRVNNSPYLVWTDAQNGGGPGRWENGYINIAPIAINANGAISYDLSRRGVLGRSSFSPAVFEFNNTPYIVWTSSHVDGGLINIAPIAINANGIISYDQSRRVVLPERAVVSTVFEFNNLPYIIWTYFGEPMFIAPIAINANGAISYDQSRKFFLDLPGGSGFPFAVFEFNNTPYIIHGGNINIAPIAINANGAIGIDLSRNYVLPETNFPIQFYSGCTAFEFNNTPYIVWTSPRGGLGDVHAADISDINIAPIAINANGIISYDPSRKFVLPPLSPYTSRAISSCSIMSLSSSPP